MLDLVTWMAMGAGALYAAASFLAALYFSTERFQTWRLMLLSLLWLPILIIIGIAVGLSQLWVKGPIPWKTGPITGKMWISITFRCWGVAFIRMDRKELNETTKI